MESVHFYRNGREIVAGSFDCLLCTLAITDKGTVALYVRPPFSLSESDSWTCLVRDDGNPKQQQMNLDEATQVALELDGQEVAPNGLISVRENESIDLKCISRNSSTTRKLHWFVKDSNITSAGRMSLDILPDGRLLVQSQLKLNASKALDKLQVNCMAQDPLWPSTVNASASLNILYKPSFYISRLPSFRTTVYEGMRVVLKCNIYANPSSSPIWVRETVNRTGDDPDTFGESIELRTDEEGELIFTSVHISDSGWYRCRTENSEGNFSSTPYFLQVQPSAERLQSFAPNTSNLKAPNQPLELATQNRDINKQHQQQYTQFQANNYNYNTTTSAANQCLGIPKIEQPVQVITGSIGRPLTLTMRFCCQPKPLRVFWIHRHLALIPGHLFGPYTSREIYNIYNSFYCYQSTFEIEAFRPEDVGTVYGFVSNERGHAGAQFHLQISSLVASDLAAARPISQQFSDGHLQTSPKLVLILFVGSLSALYYLVTNQRRIMECR